MSKRIWFVAILLFPSIGLFGILSMGPWLASLGAWRWFKDPLIGLFVVTLVGVAAFFIIRPCHMVALPIGFLLSVLGALAYGAVSGDPSPMASALVMTLYYGLPWSVLTMFIAWPSIREGKGGAKPPKKK